MQSERMWLITVDLIITGCVILFFLVAPLFRYPLTYDEAYGVMQIRVPDLRRLPCHRSCFRSAPSGGADGVPERRAILRMLVRGPLFLFAIGIIAVWIVFGVSNSRYGVPGAGMTLKVFSNLHTGLLSILSATTGGLIAFLFPLKDG